MVCYFSDDNINKMADEFLAMRQRFADLRQRYLVRPWVSAKGREFATHGFARRLSMLVRSIEMVYSLLPPEQQQEDVPGHDTVTEATVAIQAFVINASGCIDNLAWVWVHEKDVRRPNGEPLPREHVGLRSANKSVRATFTKGLRDYLDTREEWFDHLTHFRDSLAHRVPLYIPPYIITPEKLDQYNQLSAEANAAAAKGDADGFWKADKERDALGIFRPWMVSAVTDDKAPVVFHAQLIADYNTVHEIGERVLAELGAKP
jgi:hypothetical protein